MKIQIPDSHEEISLGQIIQLGNLKTDEDQADYFLKDVCDFDGKLHMDDKKSLLATFYQLLGENKVVSTPCNIKTKTLNLKLLKNLLDMRVYTFIELVNIDLKEDSFENCNAMTACFYREDFSKPYSEAEWIKIAEELYDEKLTVALWGVKLYEKLITLLKDTFPILYEGGGDGQDEGRRAYGMLNTLAGDNAINWDEAGNLTLRTAFLYMENKAIEADKRKQNGR